MKQFLSPDAGANFKPSPDGIRVIRPVGEPQNNPDDPVVTIKFREVGLLKQDGVLEPSDNPAVQTLALKIGEVGGQNGLFLLTPLPGVLISDQALGRYYKRQPIYFWDEDHTGLVPDVRYLPLDLPEAQRPRQILDWLTNGPRQDWLAGVVEPLPQGTKPIGNVPAINNQTLQISLSGQALPDKDAAAALQRLQQQLRWSLRPLPNTLALNVEHQDYTFSGDDYLTANPAYQPEEAQRFALYNKQIVRLAQSYRSGDPVPIIRSQDNRNIRSAALATAGSRSYAALVVEEPGGRLALKVGATGAGDTVTLTRKRLSGTIGRPVWATSPIGADPGTYGLIPINGALYSFPADGFRTRERGLTVVDWPGGAPGGITSVAVAPDARRVALIAGGALYLAGLDTGDGGLKLVSPHVVRAELESLTTVTWSTEDSLALAGLKPGSQRYAIMEVTIDGAAQNFRQDDFSSTAVTDLTSRPANPARSDDSGAVAYMVGGSAYDDQRTGKITVKDLAQTVTDPPPNIVPTAPFFLN
ncbi:LpqB family beta-propeller domain-containing protein [Actinoplanes sp. NPDC049265]|uniref:LpqB family beta-propeller domain-containing protein n=1 Tax=Actinoplanes sp. NPDC049265 TaxID=3363902 RepID=UPI0037220284